MTKSRYEILDEIAAGGMATVYVGRHRGALGFQRLVAIKRAHAFVARGPEQMNLLEREARLASQIHHPNVVEILDVEEVAGEVCLILEYVEGCSVRDLQKSQRIDGDDQRLPSTAFRRTAIRMILDAGKGLAAAHAAKDPAGEPLGIVHRDVSPHNLLTGRDGVTRIADFGIARAEVTQSERTATGVLKGKLAYSPPEYVETQRFDERSDLFALAVVTWELLAGRSLFGGATEAATLRNVLACAPEPLDRIDPNLGGIADVVHRALALHPSERQPDVATFVAELEHAAIALGLLGTHEEVALLVEEAVGVSLSARRARIARASPRTLEELDAARKAPFARDDEATASLAGEAVKSGSGSHASARSSGEEARPSEEHATDASPKRRKGLAIFGSLVAVAVIGGFVASRVQTSAASSGASIGEVVSAPRATVVASNSAGRNDLPVSTASTASGSARPAPSSVETVSSSSSPKVTPRPRKKHVVPAALPTHAPGNPYGP